MRNVAVFYQHMGIIVLFFFYIGYRFTKAGIDDILEMKPIQLMPAKAPEKRDLILLLTLIGIVFVFAAAEHWVSV